MAPVTLTRGQFLAKRPHGSYKKYLRYIGAHRPPPDPIMEQAQAMVNASLTPVKAQYDAAAKARMADALAASRAAKGFTEAFGHEAAAIPNTAGSAYQAAAQALAGYSSGLQGRAQDIATNAGTAAMEEVARMSGAPSPAMPDAAGALSVPREMERINEQTFVGRAPLVTRALNALDTAARLKNADWADLERYKGVQEASQIRDKFLIEAAKRPGLIQQAYLALQKNSRDADQLQMLKDQLDLKRLHERINQANSKAERAAAQRALDLKEKEIDAKIAGQGYYKKYPPSQASKATAWQKNHAKRLEIISDIASDNHSLAKKFALDVHGHFPKPGMTTAKIRKHLIGIYWPKLKAAKAGGEARTEMLNAIDALIAELVQQFPILAGKPTKPATGSSDSSGSGFYGGNN